MLPGKTYKPEDILVIAWRRRWQIIVPFLLVAGGAIRYAQTLPDRYRSETVILIVPQRVPESYVHSTVTSRIEDRLRSINQQIMSRTRLEPIIQTLNLYPGLMKNGLVEDAVARMRLDADVQVVKGDAFRVSFIANEPRTAMKVTQQLASLFIDENLKDREVLAEDTNQFLDSQLDNAKQRLIEHEKKLEEYRKRYAGQLPTQVQSNLQVIQNAQMQIQSINDSIGRDRDRRLMLERQVADSNADSRHAQPGYARRREIGHGERSSEHAGSGGDCARSRRQGAPSARDAVQAGAPGRHPPEAHRGRPDPEGAGRGAGASAVDAPVVAAAAGHASGSGASRADGIAVAR